MISITCCKGLPLEYESFLMEKYDSFLTTCRYIEIFHQESDDIHYLLFHENDILIALLIFEIKGEKSTCLNLLAYLNQELLSEFTKYVFKNFPSVQKIVIDSCYNRLTLGKSVLFRRSEDFIIQLPSTIDTYYQELGRSTRKNIRRLKNKLLKDYPAVNFITKTGTEIEESVIDKIVHMNFDRTIYKRKVPNKNHSITNNIYKYSQYYGCVCYIEIDGLIIAGSIAIEGNNSVSSLIVGHDNDFSKYNAGQLSMVHLIQTSIEKGYSSLHLLWGELEYKTTFLAKPQQSLSYMVYRNYSATFFVSKVKELISGILNRIRLSKLSLPLRNVVKLIKRKSIKQLSKMEY